MKRTAFAAPWKHGNVHIVSFFHSLWGHAALNGTMIAIANDGLIASFAAFAWAVARRRPAGLFAYLAVGAVAAVAFAIVAGHLFFDRRPFVSLGIAPLIAHSSDNGFPSDHSAVAAFVAGVLWFLDAPAAIVATIAAAVIGVARVYALVHWPMDVIAGWLVGAIPAVIAMLLWRARHG
ncbi:MAG: phosphatase PAP2 family protein [Candidatus Eremiobacteraeota bacterium]|nr:phosphatase PAP2 family protein [Candidatus Eremiobacteraeota bacterium]